VRLALAVPSLLLAAVCGCGVGGAGGPGPSPSPGAGTVSPPGGEGREILPSLPLWEPELGQEVRATVGTFPPISGELRALGTGVLLLQAEGEPYPLRLNSIRVLEVRRHRRTRALEGGVVGAVAGALVGRLTLGGIGGDHWESQGEVLAPGLGAILGGLVGALLGWQIGGDYWEEVRIPASAAPGPIGRGGGG
jgi:hypothetical protein